MIYQGKEIEILSRKSVFGKQIAEVKILSTGEVKSVPFSELSDEKEVPTDAEIAFKSTAAKIKSVVFKQAMLAPIESNIGQCHTQCVVAFSKTPQREKRLLP